MIAKRYILNEIEKEKGGKEAGEREREKQRETEKQRDRQTEIHHWSRAVCQ